MFCTPYILDTTYYDTERKVTLFQAKHGGWLMSETIFEEICSCANKAQETGGILTLLLRIY